MVLGFRYSSLLTSFFKLLSIFVCLETSFFILSDKTEFFMQPQDSRYCSLKKKNKKIKKAFCETNKINLFIYLSSPIDC